MSRANVFWSGGRIQFELHVVMEIATSDFTAVTQSGKHALIFAVWVAQTAKKVRCSRVHLLLMLTTNEFCPAFDLSTRHIDVFLHRVFGHPDVQTPSPSLSLPTSIHPLSRNQ